MYNPRAHLSVNSNELFGGEAPKEVRVLIDAAKSAPQEEQSERLWAIQRHAPSCLPVYYLLYKLHAGRRELARAERAALLGLVQAGLQSDLPGDVELILTTPLPSVDFMTTGPARFWLFTLKALAFIRMRSGRIQQARQLLDFIARCDPKHSVGSDVILALLRATAD